MQAPLIIRFSMKTSPADLHFRHPRANAVPSLLGDLELKGLAGLALYNGGTGKDPTALCNAINAKSNQIATPKFAVDCQIEQRQFSRSPALLKPEANSPDLVEFERRFLADDPTFVPGRSWSFDAKVIDFHLMFSHWVDEHRG